MGSDPYRSYEDHPSPSVILMALYGAIVAMAVYTTASAVRSGGPTALLGPTCLLIDTVVAILAFHMWQLHATYYTMSAAGIEVRYGPWRRLYAWSDFSRMRWKRGLFATRIGWPPTTPCVRMWDGVVLQRRKGRFGLYLTPADSREFLRRAAELAPELASGLDP